MACGITDPLSCAGQLAGAAAGSAWDAICQSFAGAADTLLAAFARAFMAIPPVDLSSPGVKNVYAICLGIAAVIAALLLLGQVIRTALTHDGSGLAEGLAGVGKAAAAFMLTLVIASAAVTAADGLTTYIIDRSFGSATALTAKITGLLSFTGSAGQPAAEAGGSASLLLLLAIIGILLIVVLWFELLLRNAAIAVLVATSPIAAAGQVSAATRSWWPKMAAATGQLIILKPVIALIFALGLELTGQSHDIETLLAGMLILLLAVIAWPVVARFLTFATVGGGSAGLGAVLGFAAGRLSTGSSLPQGTAAGPAAEADGTAGAAGAQAGAGAATAGVLGLAAAGIQAAHKTAAALAGRMDQTAGHAGLASPAYGYGGSAGGSTRYARPQSAREQPDGYPPGTAGPSDPDSDWPARDGAEDWPGHYPADTTDDWAAGPAASSAEPVPATGPEDWPEDYPAGTADGWAAGHPGPSAEPASAAISERPATPHSASPRPGGSGPGEPGADDVPLPPAAGGETTEGGEERS